MANGGGGALEAQQRIAADIPYKNIALENPADRFLNAWSMATQLKLKKSEIEGKMQALAERNRQLEMTGDLREREFSLRAMMDQSKMQHMGDMYDLATQRLELDSTRATNTAENQRQRNEIAMDAFDLRKNQDERRINAQGGMASLEAQLSSEGLTPGTREYQKALVERATPYLRDLPTSESNAWLRQLYNNSNTASERETRQLQMKQEMMRRDIGSTLFGNPAVQDLSPLLHPEDLPDEKVATPGIPWHFWETTPPKTTGRKLLISVDAAGRPIQKAVSMADLTRARKQYEDVMKEQGEIAPKINDPDLGVYAKPASTLRDRALRVRENPGASAEAKAAAEQYLNNNP